MDETKIAAAVAVVERNAARALAADRDLHMRDYIEAYAVAAVLTTEGILERPATTTTSHVERDAIDKRLTGQAKRLLEEAADQGRIVRWSTAKQGAAPHLDGNRRTLYGNAVGYTTTALFERAERAVEETIARMATNREAMADLKRRAQEAGMPDPSTSDATSVTYGVEAFRALVELVEDKR